MSKDEAEFLEELRSLSITAAHELLSGVDRLKALRDEVRDDDDVRKEIDPKRAKMNDLAFGLARDEIRRAEKILSLSHNQADLMFAHAKALIRRVRGKGEAPRTVVEVSAQPPKQGDPADAGPRGEHTIRNPFGRLADPRFHLHEVTDSSGTRYDGLTLALACVPGRVPAHGHAVVTISVKPGGGAADLVPGVYFAHLEIYLSDDIEREVARLLVKVRIEGANRP